MTAQAPQNTATQPSESTAAPRRLILLGSTGSIGTNTLRVVDNLAPAFKVVGLAAGSNAELLLQQADQFKPEHVAIASGKAAAELRANLKSGKAHSGASAAAQLVEATDADILVAAMVGAAGLPPTLKAIHKGMDIALANKETLVAAGPLVMPLVKRTGVKLLPVDSEHSAIFQCIHTSATTKPDTVVKQIVLTASGGPFRNASKSEIQNATVEQALAHPTWKMGPKITIDSATMMNKALEIIEAHWLFDLAADQIKVIIHPQSIAHSFVEFNDNSILAQLGPPDMKTPIQYALTFPNRATGCSDAMDWSTLSQLDFQQPDFERFPALTLAYKVIELGGTAGAILNAANEQAVAAFLDRKIPFGQIVDLAAQALEQIETQPTHDLNTIQSADATARRFVINQIEN